LDEIPASIDLNPSGNQADSSVIWLHGLGADGSDFVPIVEQFDLPDSSKVRFIFPHAPLRTITVNNGMRMRAWYDIIGFDIAQREDGEGIEDSEKLVGLLIEREIELGVPSERIILAGFSQGGAISLYTGLRYSKPLGGIIALSAYLPLADQFTILPSSENKDIPIFMAHGMFDPIVPLILGQMSKDKLQNLGYKIEWHSYSMEHTVIAKEIEDIGKFIKKVL